MFKNSLTALRKRHTTINCASYIFHVTFYGTRENLLNGRPTVASKSVSPGMSAVVSETAEEMAIREKLYQKTVAVPLGYHGECEYSS